MLFADRHDAGRQLAELLKDYRSDLPVVVGLPRGGVPVAFEVAQALNARLDIMGVRKLGAPGNPEYGIGAIAEENVQLANRNDLLELNVSQSALSDLITSESAQLQSRLDAIRATHPEIDVAGRTVLLIDDGLATGITALAAVRALRRRGAEKVVLGVPVCAATIPRALRGEADAVHCVATPDHLRSVGGWYQDFNPTTDAEVLALLEASRGTA